MAGCKPADTPAPADTIALLNTCEQTIESLTATDRLGRNVPAIKGTDGEKYVGMFYFLWNGQERSKQTKIYDNTRLMELLGDEF